MGRAEAQSTIRVALAWSPRAGAAFEMALELPAGSSALAAIRASGVLGHGSEIDLSTQPVGIWGKAATLETLLADGDRVEIYRPLAIDPKEARRRRAARK